MTSSSGAILFDLDGTLVDSRVVIARHWAAFASRHGLELEPILAVCHGRRTADTIADIAPWLDVAAEAARLDGDEETDVEGLVRVRGAAELLEALSDDVWAIVTSGHRSLATRRLTAVGLPVPAVMVCGDEVAHGKPDPQGFLAAAALLGVDPSECVVVEDAPAGIEAGRRAGARTLAVTTTHAAAELTGADEVVDDLEGAEDAFARLGFPIGVR